MDEFFVTASEFCAMILNYIALLVIAYGGAQAAWSAARVIMTPDVAQAEIGTRFVSFGRWLVVGLTFQLAADVIETATTTTEDGWQDVGRLAAIAVIRTFLSYFLERDMKDAGEFSHREERQEEA